MASAAQSKMASRRAEIRPLLAQLFGSSAGAVGAAVPLALLDLGARAAVPAALLALAHDLNDGALLAALVVNLLTLARGLLSGRLVARLLRRGWQAFVTAARAHSVSLLRARPAEQSAAMFVEATHRTAMVMAQLVPRLLADASGLVLCAFAVVWLLGPVWLLAGFVGVAAAAPVLLWTQRRMRHNEQHSFEALAELSLDVGALLDAPAELRAHDRDAAMAEGMRVQAQKMARAMQRTHTLSSLLSLLPLGIALLVAVMPLRALGSVRAELLDVAQAGILGAAAVSFAMSLVRSAEGWSRSAPQRQLYARFVYENHQRQHQDDVTNGPGWVGELVFEGVSVRHKNAAQLTPAPVDFRWPDDDTGVALLGPNGAGKSSLVMVLFGLLEPCAGSLTMAGEPLNAAQQQRLRRQVIYLPQSPFVEASRSVEWHLRLVLGDEPSPAALRRALETTELWPLLERRGARRGVAPLALPVAELSGGEQQRMHLARAFVAPAEGRRLIVLDEPEAALDSGGRALLLKLLGDLAKEARVLLIAHDPAVVPKAFTQLHCRAQGVVSVSND